MPLQAACRRGSVRPSVQRAMIPDGYRAPARCLRACIPKVKHMSDTHTRMSSTQAELMQPFELSHLCDGQRTDFPLRIEADAVKVMLNGVYLEQDLDYILGRKDGQSIIEFKRAARAGASLVVMRVPAADRRPRQERNTSGEGVARPSRVDTLDIECGQKAGPLPPHQQVALRAGLHRNNADPTVQQHRGCFMRRGPVADCHTRERLRLSRVRLEDVYQRQQLVRQALGGAGSSTTLAPVSAASNTAASTAPSGTSSWTSTVFVAVSTGAAAATSCAVRQRLAPVATRIWLSPRSSTRISAAPVCASSVRSTCQVSTPS
jgi:hypothetical protein